MTTLTGTTGPDTLTGTSGDDTIEGLAGNDSLIGGGGTDSLRGGEGDDTLVGSTASAGSTLDGGAGDDRLRGQRGVAEVFVPGPGNDHVDGGIVDDLFTYADLATVSYAAASAPIVVDWTGYEEANFGTGLVSGGSTAGGAGSDTLTGVHHLIATAFDDTLVGSAARVLEIFDGGAGNDSIDGGLIDPTRRADNRVDYSSATAPVSVDLAAGRSSGGGGNDTLVNIDIVWASGGDDTLAGSALALSVEQFIPGAGHDHIDGREGLDWVRYDRSPELGPIVADLAAGTVSDGLGDADTLAGIEGLFGTALNDTLTGSDNPLAEESFEGGAGSDLIDGRGGTDWALYTQAPAAVSVTLGGAGAGSAFDGADGLDTLLGIEAVEGSRFDDLLTGSDSSLLERFYGGHGRDTIDGRGGPDEVSYERGTTTDTVDRGVSLDLDAGFANADPTDTLLNIEHATGTLLGDDALRGSGLANRLRGLGGDDVILGRAGDDTLEGGDGDDELIPGTGADLLDGGAGTDTVQLLAARATYTLSRAAADALRLVNGATLETVTLREVELVGFTDQTVAFDTLFDASGPLAASAFADTLEGTAGADSIDALGGDDSVSGHDGVDTLLGGDGNDTLRGGAQSDLLFGGRGNDLLDGGPIADSLFSRGLNNAYYTLSESGVVANLATGIASDGMGGQDTLVSIQNLLGSAFADTLIGSATLVTESFDPGGGDDAVDGGALGDPLSRDSNRLLFTSAGAGVSASLASGRASGGAGNDTLGNIDVLVGSIHADTLAGSHRSDRVEQFAGGPGADVIDGGGGLDWLRYDTSVPQGAVVIDLGAGRATNDGQGQQDTVLGIEGAFGGGFADSLSGSDRSDVAETFHGGAGNDRIDGRGGIDGAWYLLATSGVNANLALGQASDGQGGSDTLIGIESLMGSPHADTLLGSMAATLEIFEGFAGNDHIDGSSGPDEASYRRAYERGVVVDLSLGVASDDGFGAAGSTDTLSGIEHVTGSLLFGDSITGNAGDNALSGLGGDDTLRGMAGQDTLDGGDGNDLAQMLGPRAAYHVTRPESLVLVLTHSGTGESHRLLGIEQVAFSDGTHSAASLQAQSPGPGSGNDTLAGSAGSDTIDGLAGDDRIDGGAGDDDLRGSAGNDTLLPGTGRDTVDGGDGGDDRLELAGPRAGYIVSLPPGGGLRLVSTAQDQDVLVAAGVEFVLFTDGAQAIGSLGALAGAPTLHDDLLIGTDGPDRIDALDGNDSVRGLDGDDTLFGLAGNDTLVAGAGLDRLHGGDGDDGLIGGLASFNWFFPGAGNDTVDGGPDDTQLGGFSADILGLAGATAVVVDLAAGSVQQGGDTDLLSGIDAVFGSRAGDLLLGVNSADPAQRGDTLRGGGGNDTIDGRGGVDTAEYSGAFEGYLLTRTGAASWTVQDTLPGSGGSGGNSDDGFDEVNNIERFVFADRLLAFGARAEELARVAFVLWHPAIVGSTTLFGRGFSFYDNGYSFIDMSFAALQFWTAESDAALATRLIGNSGSAKTQAQVLATMAANGGGLAGRAAALREIALDAATTLRIEESGIRTHGVVADLFVPDFGQLFDLLPPG